MKIRVGQGYDVHRLVPDRPLILGGIEIPHTLGLAGHSDADVVIHSLCDALLGAAGLGDIGKHYPDSDSSYANIDSRILLRDVMQKLTGTGWALGNADITIIAQAPRLAGHIPAMRERIAEDLQSDVEQVNIKATTTEKLGFCGREEGIAAMACVLIQESDV
ncbi:MAG TPA: 2-C-methyl-D-erythritol 2,4-cyclodiphosphate synthase [Gammaproteobacteria bacterium]|nr:2-C-methyl-D-erythritol 2,4-cyclodiphosphate synthase [Gammaproteobacteria bacterium]